MNKLNIGRIEIVRLLPVNIVIRQNHFPIGVAVYFTIHGVLNVIPITFLFVKNRLVRSEKYVIFSNCLTALPLVKASKVGLW